MLSFFDVLSIYLLAPLALISWLVYGILWRLYLSPLACFPGPKLAALTLWYECYYDVFKPGGGMYIWEIEKMHQRYGMSSYTFDCHAFNNALGGMLILTLG